MDIVVPLEQADSVAEYGGKAANLAKLVQAGLPVPSGLVVGIGAFNDKKLTKDAEKSIKQYVTANSNKLFAVRSSALAEDAEGASWAGQFESFLNVAADDVLQKIEECHNSSKDRARAYSSEKGSNQDFNIAVVVQEMLKPEYAGVLFTKDPLTSKDKSVIEYVEGLGEELVSGRTDPKRVDEAGTAPFDVNELTGLAADVEQAFGVPQDIEWVWENNKIWLVQARPITVTQTTEEGYNLGEPEDLFYWGPSRAKPVYMSDFMVAAEDFFTKMFDDPKMSNPPKTLVLFHEGKNVWLINATDFAGFTEATFAAYEKRNKLYEDVKNWEETVEQLDGDTDNTDLLLKAWSYTLFAEFSLYGAETNLAKRLKRFDSNTRQDIWGAFTMPDNSTFLGRIDQELIKSKDPKAMAKKYPWIEDGYNGLSDTAKEYFIKRLKILENSEEKGSEHKKDRVEFAKKLKLSEAEVNALNLTRHLAEFMDNRKAWMMRTRRYITKPLGTIEHGWFFYEGKSQLLNESETAELWNRYIDFKASSSVLSGLVASNGGRHFITGEVAVIDSPTASIVDDLILVVPSTSPSYVPLMRKAKALVTDHGGMMSHAAIVAREFNLPCIVGTKQATKALKSGDKVVLDLVKGVISK